MEDATASSRADASTTQSDASTSQPAVDPSVVAVLEAELTSDAPSANQVEQATDAHAAEAASGTAASDSGATAAPQASSEAACGASSSSSAAPPVPAVGADAEVFEVKIKCIDSTTTTLEVPSDLRGADLKELIAERLEAPPDRQRLIFRGRVVKDDDTVGQHITENGQTLHMVQRPAPSANSSEQPSSNGAGPGIITEMTGGPQVHFQFTTTEGGPMGMPQVDLSQILGTVFQGTVGRGGGIGVVHSTPVPTGQARAAGPSVDMAQQHGQGMEDANSAPVATAPASMHGPMPAVMTGMLPQTVTPMTLGPHGMPVPAVMQPGVQPTMPLGNPQTQPGVAGGSTSAVPHVAPGAGPVPAGAAYVPAVQQPGAVPMATGMAPEMGAAGVAIQPLQIVFQQGLGNLAHMLPTMLGETFQIAETVVPRGPPAAGGESGQPGTPQPNPSNTGDVLPWRDLRRLHQQLARLLGRSGHSRTIPPSNMPGGELNTFLSMLLGAITQLSVAISDVQAAFLDQGGPQPRFRLQLAMALVAAARTFRGMATALQSGPLQGRDDQSSGEPASSAAPAPVQQVAEASPLPGGSSDSEEVRLSDSSQGQEAVGDAEAAVDGGIRHDEEVLEVEIFPSTGATLVAATASGSDGSTPLAAEMVQQLFGQLSSAQPAAQFSQMDLGSMLSAQEADERPSSSASPPADVLGPLQQQTEDALSTMPPEVAELWRRWAKSEAFCQVVSQANEPAFSQSYASGDATGSDQSPQLPQPADFLPLRWERTIARMEADLPVSESPEVPESPEHLSRAYLSAFLRDLGHHVQGHADFRDSPEAAERFPHLTRYARFFSQSQPSQSQPSDSVAGRQGDSGPDPSPMSAAHVAQHSEASRNATP